MIITQILQLLLSISVITNVFTLWKLLTLFKTDNEIMDKLFFIISKLMESNIKLESKSSNPE